VPARKKKPLSSIKGGPKEAIAARGEERVPQAIITSGVSSRTTMRWESRAVEKNSRKRTGVARRGQGIRKVTMTRAGGGKGLREEEVISEKIVYESARKQASFGFRAPKATQKKIKEAEGWGQRTKIGQGKKENRAWSA